MINVRSRYFVSVRVESRAFVMRVLYAATATFNQETLSFFALARCSIGEYGLPVRGGLVPVYVIGEQPKVDQSGRHDIQPSYESC